MCGICGIFSQYLNDKEKEMFAQSLGLNLWRGRDGTGVTRVDEAEDGYDFKTITTLKNSWEWLTSKTAANFIKAEKKEPVCFLGHTRSATKGTVTVENQHPFEFDKIIGMHNGTIHFDFPGSSQYDTDSEAVFKLINDHGIKKAIEEISYTGAAYSLSWIDKEEETLNFIKNSERPLNFVFFYARSTLLWSSEAAVLQFIMKKHKHLKGESYSDEATKKSGAIWTLHPNQLMQIPLEKSPKEFTLTDMGVEEKRTGKSRVYAASNYSALPDVWRGGYYQDSGWEGDQPDIPKFLQKHGGPEFEDQTYSTRFGSKLTDLPWLEEKTEVEIQEHWEEAPKSEKELEHKLQGGCGCCLETFTPLQDEAMTVHWYTRDIFYCDECYNDSENDWVKWMFEGMENAAVH